MFASGKNLLKICVCTLCYFVTSVTGKAQYVEPLNSGLQMCVPYDIANIFIRPISATVSTFLSIAMFLILFFGVITSPFGYMFGIPSRKYVLGSPSDVLTSQSAGTSRDFHDEGQDLFMDRLSSYNFTNSLLFLLPEDFERDCNLMLVCYAHGIFKKLPTSYLKVYRVFSQKLMSGEADVKIAARIGLGGHLNCERNYKKCPYGPFKLVVSCYLRALGRIKI